MRRLCFLMAILTLGIASQSVVEAGQRGIKHRSHRGAGLGGDRIGAALELTDDQRQALDALRDEFKQTAQQIRDGGLTREEAKPQIEAQREARRAAVSEILTQEQLERLQQIRAENQDRPGSRGHHRRGFRGRGGLARATKALDLTGDQQTALAALREEARQAHREIRNQVREGSLTREEARSLLEGQRTTRQAALAEILTPEQLAQLEELRNARRHKRDAADQNGDGGIAEAARFPPAPDMASLLQNAPNPFNPETEIRFDVSREAFVNVSVYNTVGQKVATLVDNYVSPGIHSVQWNAANNPSGIYFYRLESNGAAQTRRMLLLK